MGSMDKHFLKYMVNRLYNEIIDGQLSVSFIRVTKNLWEYVPKTSVAKKAEEQAKAEPKKHDPTDRTAKGYDPWKDPSRDYEIELKIKQGLLNEEGVIVDPTSSYLGKKWRELYPLKRN